MYYSFIQPPLILYFNRFCYYKKDYKESSYNNKHKGFFILNVLF